MNQTKLNRRDFLNKSTQCTLATAGLAIGAHAMSATPTLPPQTINANVFGPRDGYTPQISILVSMMDWMRGTVLQSVRGLSQKDLDYIHDDDSNSIGAMLLHLAATERYYQLNSFKNMSWGSWGSKIAAEWDTPMNLGERGRQMIKGNDLDYYLDKLSSVREATLVALKSKDDKWLLATDDGFVWGPTNNYCKWFHVVEHESNHNGQIKYIRSRVS